MEKEIKRYDYIPSKEVLNVIVPELKSNTNKPYVHNNVTLSKEEIETGAKSISVYPTKHNELEYFNNSFRKSFLFFSKVPTISDSNNLKPASLVYSEDEVETIFSDFEAYDYKTNPWEYLVRDMFYKDKTVYHKDLNFSTLIRFGLCYGGVVYNKLYGNNTFLRTHAILSNDLKKYISSKLSHLVTIENFIDKDETEVGFDYSFGYDMGFVMTNRRRDVDTNINIPKFYELTNFVDNFFYENIAGGDDNAGYRAFSGFFKLKYSLPNNKSTEDFMRAMVDWIHSKPVVGNNLNNLFGSVALNLGSFSNDEFDNVGNHIPYDIDEVVFTINRDNNSIFNGISASYMFCCAKINPTFVFEKGNIYNCHGMFKGTRGTTNDPKRRQYETYFSPCKLKVDLKGKKASVSNIFGFTPTTIADCFKWSYLNQKSYDAFFLNADMSNCVQFAGAFSEQVFNRVFNAEEDGFSSNMVGEGYGGYGKLTIKCPIKASTPKEEWDDSKLSVWTPGLQRYDLKDNKWTTHPDPGHIAYMCKYSHVAAIEPIIDLKFVQKNGLTQAFHNPPGQIKWPGYRGLRSQIKEVRLRNLGNMDINFAGEVTDWATTNSPDWNVESFSDESVVFMLNNMRDQSPYVAGKEDELFLLNSHFNLRIPKTWERLLTGPMIKELIRKGWVLYIGNDEKSINDCIVCAEEEMNN